MEQIRRRVVHQFKSPASHGADEQSQSSEDEHSFYSVSVEIPNRRTVIPAVQFQPNNDIPGVFEISSSPDIYDRSEAPASDDCHQPPEPLPISPVRDVPQQLEEINVSCGFIELGLTSSGLGNAHQISRSTELRQPQCSTLENVENTAQLQYMDLNCHQNSELIMASPDLDSFQPSNSKNDSPNIDRRFGSQGLDTRYHHAFNDNQIQTNSEAVSTPQVHDTFDHVPAGDYPASLQEIGSSLQALEAGTQEPPIVQSVCQLSRDVSSVPALFTIDPSVHLSDFDTIGQSLPSTDIDAAEPSFPAPNTLGSSLPALGLRAPEQSHYENLQLQAPELLSSSPNIDTLDPTEPSGDYPNQSSDLIGSSSFTDTGKHSIFTGDVLRQSLELDQVLPSFPILAQPQPVYGGGRELVEALSAMPSLDTTSIRPQFGSDSPPSMENLTFSDTNSQISIRSGDEMEEDAAREEVEIDISPLDYARQNDLCRDHLKEPYPVSNVDVFGDYQNGLTDDSHLPQFELTANVNTDEPLTVSKDALLLIDSVAREESCEWVGSAMLRMIDTRKYRNFRLELPLLKSDHETDCKKFAQRQYIEIKLQDIMLPLEIVDEDNNGGLTFSRNLWRKGPEALERIEKEKLEVSRDTLVYMQNTLKNDWTGEDQKKMWESIHTYKRNTALDPVTPPLSPMAFPAQLYEPSLSDPAFDLPILSDPESLTKQDLAVIEDQIFEDDVPTPIRNARNRNHDSSDTLVGNDTIKMADIYSPAASLDMPPVYPNIGGTRTKYKDMKVEELLSPAKRFELPKTITFDAKAMECPHAVVSPPIDPFESSFFEDAFGDAHENATRICEQETLIPADTTARVDVPIMDFTQPIPPWRSGSTHGSILDTQKGMTKEKIGQNFPKWPSNGKLDLRWNPFPQSFARVALEETFIADDSAWQAFVKKPVDDDVIDTSTLTWKPPGLRILKVEDDDDEIEPSQFEKGRPQDLSYLVKKRKMEIEGRDGGLDPVVHGSTTCMVTEQPAKKKTPQPNGFVSAANKLQPDRPEKRGGLLVEGAFSVGNAVDNFLEIRGAKKPKLDDSSYFTKTSAQTKVQPTPAKPSPQPELLMQLPIRRSPLPKTVTPLPAPPVKVTNAPVNVIIASTLLKHRALIKCIEFLFPGIILVERDFSAHDTTIWMPGTVARSPIVSPLASEADMIVSSSVGIIITTLQKIGQKPLPGQKAKPAIRDRLEKVSGKYEKLIVLVTEGREDETARELDERDCTAFGDFVAFAFTLQTTVNVQYIGGGEGTLAKWVASAISHHKVAEKLIADETHWELFLRRTGLNAFAAQAIVGALKAPDGVEMSNNSKLGQFGLAAFVEMGREQRIARFGPICGSRLMERVSATIDAKWA